MVSVVSLRVVAVLLFCIQAFARKGGEPSKIDTSNVLNPDPNAPDPRHSGEYNTGPDLVEGDLKIPGGRKAGASNRNAASDPNKLWPQGVVPYVLAPVAQTAKVQDVVQAAIADFNQFTCIKFQPRSNEIDYIRITTEFEGCYSRLGRVGEMQDLNLGKGCKSKGVAIHEMMHAIGFEHEHKRRDRDRYVQIHFNNIEEEAKFNFEKIPQGKEDNQGFGYDFSSIMHYHPFAFALDRNSRTITTRDPRNQDKIGQRKGFSQQDAQEVNRLYKCNGKTSGIGGENGCRDKDRRYCEDELKLKNGPNHFCNSKEASRDFCKKSCKVCGGGGGGGPTPGSCEDVDKDFCENDLNLKNGPNHLCNHKTSRDYCKKSCKVCGDGGGGGPTPGSCEDVDKNFCENDLNLKNGPNHLCNHETSRDYCKKSCRAC